MHKKRNWSTKGGYTAPINVPATPNGELARMLKTVAESEQASGLVSSLKSLKRVASLWKSCSKIRILQHLVNVARMIVTSIIKKKVEKFVTKLIYCMSGSADPVTANILVRVRQVEIFTQGL